MKLMGEDITIAFHTATSAFSDEPASEIGRVLRDLADAIEDQGALPRVIKDSNGEALGECRIKPFAQA